MSISKYPLIITLNVNGLNAAIKRHRVADWIKKNKTVSYIVYNASQVVLVVKNQPASAGDVRDLGSIPELGRSPGVGNDNPL